MTYNWKAVSEIAWALFLAAITYLAGVLVFFNPTEITDWRAWGIALFAGCVRAVMAALIALLSKSAITIK